MNRCNLTVFLSIAELYRQNLEMLRSLGAIDGMLRGAAAAAGKSRAKPAIREVDRALDAARSIQRSRNRVLCDVEKVWLESWYPRVSAANGRMFLHEVDDMKDHLPDRTSDMTYLVYRAAAARGVRNDSFDWKDLKSVSE